MLENTRIALLAVFGRHAATHGLDQREGNRESQPGAGPGCLGAEKGIEDLAGMLGRKPRATVCHTNIQPVPARPLHVAGADLDAAAVRGGGADGVHGVQQAVQKDLLHLPDESFFP